MAKGTHQLSIVATGKTVIVDSVGLHRQMPDKPLEGEWLPVADCTAGVEMDLQDLRDFGNRWSAQAQLQFLATAPGQFLTFRLPVATAGRCRLGIQMTRASDYGQVQLSLDGQEIPGLFDGYSPNHSHSGKSILGTFELSAGEHLLKFTVAGKNESSRGYFIGVDAVTLEPATKP